MAVNHTCDPETDQDPYKGLDQDLKETLKQATEKRKELKQIGLVEKFMSIGTPAAVRKAERADDCHTFMDFEVYEHKQTHEKLRSLKVANFCDIRKFCPYCAERYARNTAADFLGRVSKLNKNWKELDETKSGLRMLFLTLTVRNCKLEDLKKTLQAMSRGWQRLTQQKSYQSSVIGSLRGVEYLGDKTAPGWAHPHFHAVLLVEESYFHHGYISQATWREMWRKAMRLDYDPQVNVKTVKPKRKKDGTRIPASVAAALEVAKYAVSMVSIERLDNDNFATLYFQTKGARQFAYGGLLNQIEPDPEEELDPAIWDYVGEEIYTWNETKGIYIKKE